MKIKERKEMKVWYLVYFGNSQKSFRKEEDAVQFYCTVLRSKFTCKIVCIIEMMNRIIGDFITSEIVLDEHKEGEV